MSTNLAATLLTNDQRTLYQMAERYAAAHHDDIAADILACVTSIRGDTQPDLSKQFINLAPAQPNTSMPLVAPGSTRPPLAAAQGITPHHADSTNGTHLTPEVTHPLEDADWQQSFHWIRLSAQLVLRINGLDHKADYVFYAHYEEFLQFLIQSHGQHAHPLNFSLQDIRDYLGQSSPVPKAYTRRIRLIIIYLSHLGIIERHNRPNTNTRLYRASSDDLSKYLHPQVIYDAREHSTPSSLARYINAKNRQHVSPNKVTA